MALNRAALVIGNAHCNGDRYLRPTPRGTENGVNRLGTQPIATPRGLITPRGGADFERELEVQRKIAQDAIDKLEETKKLNQQLVEEKRALASAKMQRDRELKIAEQKLEDAMAECERCREHMTIFGPRSARERQQLEADLSKALQQKDEMEQKCKEHEKSTVSLNIAYQEKVLQLLKQEQQTSVVEESVWEKEQVLKEKDEELSALNKLIREANERTDATNMQCEAVQQERHALAKERDALAARIRILENIIDEKEKELVDKDRELSESGIRDFFMVLQQELQALAEERDALAARVCSLEDTLEENETVLKEKEQELSEARAHDVRLNIRRLRRPAQIAAVIAICASVYTMIRRVKISRGTVRQLRLSLVSDAFVAICGLGLMIRRYNQSRIEVDRQALQKQTALFKWLFQSFAVFR